MITEDIYSEQARYNMVNRQIRDDKVLNDQILDLIDTGHRELFVPSKYKRLAYAEMNIPIGYEQVMMRPNEEARMLQALLITKQDKILEVGTGTGYVTSLLARLGKHVYSVDLFADFIHSAKQKLTDLQIDNVTLETGDAAKSWRKDMPYDVIAITASMKVLPRKFLTDLTHGGRLFVILGEAPAMQAEVFTRIDNDNWSRTTLFETVLPPMLNAPEPEAFQF